MVYETIPEKGAWSYCDTCKGWINIDDAKYDDDEADLFKAFTHDGHPMDVMK